MMASQTSGPHDAIAIRTSSPRYHPRDGLGAAGQAMFPEKKPALRSRPSAKRSLQVSPLIGSRYSATSMPFSPVVSNGLPPLRRSSTSALVGGGSCPLSWDNTPVARRMEAAAAWSNALYCFSYCLAAWYSVVFWACVSHPTSRQVTRKVAQRTNRRLNPPLLMG